MNKALADLAHWKPDQQRLERIYEERLSYRKAWSEMGHPRPVERSRSWRNYATVIDYFGGIGLIREFDDIVAQLRGEYNAEMERFGLESSPFGNDDSWINWDLAKQFYLFVNPETRASSSYRTANPLSDQQVREEIVSRHVGWEIWAVCSSTRNATLLDRFCLDPEIRRLLGPECKSSVDGVQPASWALTQLGHRIRFG